jgi:hypothetical protein
VKYEKTGGQQFLSGQTEKIEIRPGKQVIRAKRKRSGYPASLPYMVEDKMKKMKNCYLHT